VCVIYAVEHNDKIWSSYVYNTGLFYTKKHYKTPEKNLEGTRGELDVQVLMSNLHYCLCDM